MKRARRLFALLMMLAMVLTYMPATAFAASSSKAVPQSVTFTSPEMPEVTSGTKYGYAGVEGAVFTVTYSNGKTETYKYLECDEDIEDDAFFDSGFYLNGDTSKVSIEDIENISFGIEPKQSAKRFLGGENDAVFYFETGADDEEWTHVECPVKVNAVPSDGVAAVKYEHVGGPLEGKLDYYDKTVRYFYDEDELKPLAGDKLTITYYDYDYEYDEETDEEIEVVNTYDEVFTCKPYKNEWGDTYYNFVGKTWTDEDGEKHVETYWPDFFDDQIEGEWTWKSGSTGEVTISVDGVDAPQKLQVKVPEYKAITGAELVLAKGFEPRISIGQNDYIGTDAFNGEGNKIVVTYSDGTTDEFKHTIDYDNDIYGFVNSKKQHAYIDSNLSEKNITLKKNVPVELNLGISVYYDEDNDIYDYTDIKYTVTAKKKLIYAVDGGKYQYTGKIIKPKVVVKTVYGNETVPASAYKYDKPIAKNIGEYWIGIDIKDTDNYAAAEYFLDDKTLGTQYTIAPYKPAIKKLKAAKKAITVNWTKLNKSKSKKIDGYVIEYSLKKNFSKSKTKYVKKTASSVKLTKLKAKKTYYVRVYTYKKAKESYIDENGKARTYTYKVLSNPSKTLKIKTK